MIKISYDSEGDILEIKFSECPIKESEYIKENGIIVDYDEKGKIIGVEITSFSKRVGKKELVGVLAASF